MGRIMPSGIMMGGVIVGMIIIGIIIIGVDLSAVGILLAIGEVILDNVLQDCVTQYGADSTATSTKSESIDQFRTCLKDNSQIRSSYDLLWVIPFVLAAATIIAAIRFR